MEYHLNAFFDIDRGDRQRRAQILERRGKDLCRRRKNLPPCEKATGEKPPGEAKASRDLNKVLRPKTAGMKGPDQSPHASPGDEAGRDTLELECLEHADVGKSSGTAPAEREGETGPPSRLIASGCHRGTGDRPAHHFFPAVVNPGPGIGGRASVRRRTSRSFHNE